MRRRLVLAAIVVALGELWPSLPAKFGTLKKLPEKSP
jgi:hypothetical protein